MSGSSTVPGAVPAGYVLVGPIDPSGAEISEFRPLVRSDLPKLTTYDLPEAISSEISYDSLGNLINITYADGRMQNVTYNSIGELTSIITTNPIENKTETQILSYDSFGNITTIAVSYD